MVAARPGELRILSVGVCTVGEPSVLNRLGTVFRHVDGSDQGTVDVQVADQVARTHHPSRYKDSNAPAPDPWRARAT